MSYKKTGNPTGRPLTKIDEQQFEKLCAMHCTIEEIAAFFNCSDDTIREWCKRTFDKTFSAVYKEKVSLGNISLRRAQFKMAEKSVPMAIFLGKNWLGQTDKQETTVVEVEDLSPLADMLLDSESGSNEKDPENKKENVEEITGVEDDGDE